MTQEFKYEPESAQKLNPKWLNIVIFSINK